LPIGAESVADFEVARPFDDADFDVPEASRPSVTRPPEPSPMTELYTRPREATASTRGERSRHFEPTPTRGRYARIAAVAVVMDWIQWIVNLVVALLLVAYALQQQNGAASTEAAWLEGQLAWQLALSVTLGSMFYTWLVTALLALIDIESHLASISRRR
jgi:uncharacterized integral membrane protein